MAYTMIDDTAYEIQKNTRKEKLHVFFQNAKSFHHRLMANFLRKRGWVVFYLEEKARTCNGECWLKIYQESKR